MKTSGPSSHAVTSQIRTAEYFFKNRQILSCVYIVAPFIKTNFYYCIHQNIIMDPTMSQLHLIKQLQSTLSDPLQYKLSHISVLQFNSSLQAFRRNFVPHFTFSQFALNVPINQFSLVRMPRYYSPKSLPLPLL